MSRPLQSAWQQTEKGLPRVAMPPVPGMGITGTYVHPDTLKKNQENVTQFLWTLAHGARVSHEWEVLVSMSCTVVT